MFKRGVYFLAAFLLSFSLFFIFNSASVFAAPCCITASDCLDQEYCKWPGGASCGFVLSECTKLSCQWLQYADECNSDFDCDAGKYCEIGAVTGSFAKDHQCQELTVDKCYSCIAPLADCDANGGCETNLNNDVDNCGTCGNKCASGEDCVQGICEPPPPPPTCIDNDNDGYGNPGDVSCPKGSATDCNDNDASIHPGASEVLDGKDNDCDGLIDENICGNSVYEPSNGEQCDFGPTGSQTTVNCGLNYADITYTSCDSSCKAYSQPRQCEYCGDGVDNGLTVGTEACDWGVGSRITWGSGNGVYIPTTVTCPGGYPNVDGAYTCLADCSNADFDQSSCGWCGDGVCQSPPESSCPSDCDNQCHDGIKNGDEIGIDCGGSCVVSVPESCNGVDDDRDCSVDEGLTAPLCEKQLGVCSGYVKQCGGGEGWLACSYGAGYESVESICNDGLDNDCDGLVDNSDPNCIKECKGTDVDGDGFYVDGGVCGAVDCMDVNDALGRIVYPGAVERCSSSVDYDCDGLFNCADPDCAGSCAVDAGTCSDGIANGNEGGIDCGGRCTIAASEVCDNVDNNNNCVVDEGCPYNVFISAPVAAPAITETPNLVASVNLAGNEMWYSVDGQPEVKVCSNCQTLDAVMGASWSDSFDSQGLVESLTGGAVVAGGKITAEAAAPYQGRVAVNQDGSVFVADKTSITKLDANGNELWKELFSTYSVSLASIGDLKVDSAGNAYVAGLDSNYAVKVLEFKPGGGVYFSSTMSLPQIPLGWDMRSVGVGIVSAGSNSATVAVQVGDWQSGSISNNEAYVKLVRFTASVQVLATYTMPSDGLYTVQNSVVSAFSGTVSAGRGYKLVGKLYWWGYSVTPYPAGFLRGLGTQSAVEVLEQNVEFTALAFDSASNYVVAGVASGSSNYIRLYDSSANVVRQWGVPGRVYSLFVGGSSNIIASGNGFVAKYASTGALVWQKTGLSGTLYSDVGSDNAVYVSGVKKLDSNGNLVWPAPVTGEVVSVPIASVKLASDAGSAVMLSDFLTFGGTSVEAAKKKGTFVVKSSNYAPSMVIRKFDLEGNSLLTVDVGSVIAANKDVLKVPEPAKVMNSYNYNPYYPDQNSYFTSGEFVPSTAVIDSNGNLIIGGYLNGGLVKVCNYPEYLCDTPGYYSYVATLPAPAAAKFGSNGQFLWLNFAYGPGYIIEKMVVDSNGNVHMFSYNGGNLVQASEYRASFSSSGTLLYGGTSLLGHQEDVISVPDGIFAAGRFYSGLFLNMEYSLSKVDYNGNLVWRAQGPNNLDGVSTPGSNGFYGVAYDSSSKRVVATGYNGQSGVTAVFDASSGSVINAWTEPKIANSVAVDSSNGNIITGVAAYDKDGSKLFDMPSGLGDLAVVDGQILSASSGGIVKVNVESVPASSAATTPQWGKFYATHTVPAGSELAYEVVSANPGELLCTITAAQAAIGYDISGCAAGASAVKLRAIIQPGITSPAIDDWAVAMEGGLADGYHDVKVRASNAGIGQSDEAITTFLFGFSPCSGIDIDSSQSCCIAAGYIWAVSGEKDPLQKTFGSFTGTGQASCIGDDAGEFYRWKQCKSADVCQDDLTDNAACNRASDCVANGKCFSDIDQLAADKYNSDRGKVWKLLGDRNEVFHNVDSNTKSLEMCDPGQWGGSDSQVSGFVRNITGDGVEGAVVLVVGTSSSATTAADGSYSITDAGAGTYDMIASKSGEGYETDLAIGVDFPGEGSAVQDFTLLRSNLDCNDDCTKADGLCHVECNGRGLCAYSGQKAIDACNMAAPGIVDYDTEQILCCTGGTYAPIKADVQITCGNNVVSVKKPVLFKGKLVKMVVTVFDAIGCEVS